MKTPFWLKCPKLGKLGKKLAKKRAKTDNFTNFAQFLKNYLMNFFQVAPNEGSWIHLFPVKTPFWLKCPKLDKNGQKHIQKRSILQTLPNFSKTMWWIFFTIGSFSLSVWNKKPVTYRTLGPIFLFWFDIWYLILCLTQRTGNLPYHLCLTPLAYL